jgi:hypothetical protein
MLLRIGVMNVTTANDKRQRRNHMSTFTIDSDNNITAHAGLPAGADESQSFSNAKELAKLTSEWPASRLVNTWNSFAGVAPFDELKPVKKFTNRKAAVTRIWQAVACLSPTASCATVQYPESGVSTRADVGRGRCGTRGALSRARAPEAGVAS